MLFELITNELMYKEILLTGNARNVQTPVGEDKYTCIPEY